MKNLQWLGQSGHLRTLLDRDGSDEGMVVNDDECDNEDGNYLVQRSDSDLTGGGSKPPRKRQCNDASYKFKEERNIRCAMPKWRVC